MSAGVSPASESRLRLFLFRRLLLLEPAEPDEDAEVLERRGVAAALDAGGDVAEQPPHDLAAASLGQGVGEVDVVRAGERPDLLDHVVAKLLAERLAGAIAGLERDEDGDGLPLEVVGLADRGGL